MDHLGTDEIENLIVVYQQNGPHTFCLVIFDSGKMMCMVVPLPSSDVTSMDTRFQIARNDLWMKQFDRPDRVVVLDDNDYIF